MSKTCAIVINYHGARKTEKCLRSLMDQAVDTILLVDNSASPGESLRLAEIVRRLSEEKSRPAVSLHVNEENLGFGRAVNRAIRQDMQQTGGHDYYLLINNDAQATPGMVERLVSVLELGDGIALVAPAAETESGIETYVWYNRLLGTVSHSKTLTAFPYLPGCCLLFGKGLVESESLFDEAFFMYGEDALLSWRLKRKGLKIFCAEDVRVLHDGGKSSARGGFFYEYHLARCHMLMACKARRHFLEPPLFILGRVLFLTARAMLRAVRYSTLAPVLALCACWLPLKVRPAMERGAQAHEQ
jgi:N-acetylglucosaminyl-diphospho-decaprenol L-rhamnosyltransferase